MLFAPGHRQSHDRTGSAADDPFGMAAPQGIDENIAPIGGHENEVGGDPVHCRHVERVLQATSERWGWASRAS